MANQRVLYVSLVAALALEASACNWKTFEDLEQEASVRAFEAPGNYRRTGFGAVVTTFHGEVGEKRVSRLFASAGADSPLVLMRVWDGQKLSSASTVRCKKKEDCDKGVGAGGVLIPFETWAPGTAQEHHGCVYTPGDPNAYVFCETNAGAQPTFDIGLPKEVKPDASRLVFSGAPLPPEHPLGIALVGIYARSDRTREAAHGALYAQPNLLPGQELPDALLRLRLLDPRTGEEFAAAEDAGDLGFAVAAQESADGELVIAVSQPSHNRVIVATFDPRLEDDPAIEDGKAQLQAKLRTRACLKSEAPELVGVGKRLAMGDIDGDGAPEIFVGIDPLDGGNGDEQRVWMYPGSGLPAFDPDADACPQWDAKPVQVGCRDGVRGVACLGTGFGAALSVGDVDGDGFGDLIVGAPRADVQGVKEAGVVWVIPGSEGGLDVERMTNLYAASFEEKGHVGSSVAALRTDGRDEPVAGAPGSETVYLFMCSTLETGVSTLCLPK
jgi:hypothetical protein